MKLLTTFRLTAVLGLMFIASAAIAAGGDKYVEEAEIDPGNINSLQRGAANFMNYCSGCHSAKYVRFNTIGDHLELSEAMLVDNLMFNAEKTFEPIRSSMDSDDSSRWFGASPPDLSLIARSKGADYIYTFLKTYYVDPSSPTGVNNVAKGLNAMPHVLWELQGFQKAVYETQITEKEDDEGNIEIVETEVFVGFEQVTAGSMDAEDFEDFVRDTVNFLAFIGEPNRADRRRIGTWVIIYLLVFLIIASMLKKQIWKDVD
ncbi:MAG: cytochrome c1 [Pseudomonadota bacterium]